MSQKVDNVIVDLDKIMGAGKPAPKPPTDPLDSALLDADNQLARELKRTTVRRMLTEEERKLNLLEKDMGNGEEKTAKPAEQADVDPKVFQTIAGLPADQQEQAVDVYQKMVAAKGMSREAAYMPLILDTMRARPGSSTDNLVTAVTSIMELVEKARTPPASTTGDKAVDALVTLATAPKSGGVGETAQLITAIADVVKANQPQGAGPDPVATAIGMIRDLKDLGLMGNQQPAPSGHNAEVDIRLAEIKRDTDIKLAELGLKKDTEMRKLDNDEKRTNAIGGIVERAARVAGRAFAEGETGAEGQATAQAAPSADVVNTDCPQCHKQIMIPNPAQARDLECPNCHSILHWDGRH